MRFVDFNRLYFGADYFLIINQLLRVVTVAQSIVGIVSLFFLGLGLRNRFRPKEPLKGTVRLMRTSLR